MSSNKISLKPVNLLSSLNIPAIKADLLAEYERMEKELVTVISCLKANKDACVILDIPEYRFNIDEQEIDSTKSRIVNKLIGRTRDMPVIRFFEDQRKVDIENYTQQNLARRLNGNLPNDKKQILSDLLDKIFSDFSDDTFLSDLIKKTAFYLTKTDSYRNTNVFKEISVNASKKTLTLTGIRKYRVIEILSFLVLTGILAFSDYQELYTALNSYMYYSDYDGIFTKGVDKFAGMFDVKLHKNENYKIVVHGLDMSKLTDVMNYLETIQNEQEMAKVA